jgi:hypothetical protein
MPSKPADFEVLMAVQTVKALYKRALTRAERDYKWAVDAAFKHFGPTDVEQAARSNTLRRAERAYGEAIEKARLNFRTRLADIKARAGEWADLVPEAS